MKTRKTVVAYIDGKLLIEDVVQAALDNNIMLADLKAQLIKENPNNKISFVVK